MNKNPSVARPGEILSRLRAQNPNPTSELAFSTPFELLVAVVLSAQANDKRVNQATEGLFRDANTPEAILAMGEEGLRRHIRTIGLYNTKARNLMKTCAHLVERHGGVVPRDRHDLEELPGVGRKTALVIRNTAFGEPVIAVDTHVFRVANRTGIAPGKTVRQVEDKLMQVVPDEYKKSAHHWLILHGRHICVARKPKCDACGIPDLCEWKRRNAGS
uniref:Endonuclease III n=1 Tax=Candidatus Kentrum sp. UNK TaxID=2126344 RepID=A0A451AGJ8_9GAMM|nr:MAG: DNA-(apurinic or apyrimidinic site) lyase /endonuclease III [Candidatus Kentron sp. UNK]VFK71310.1 MAG: DNA-(apurinic or apyrimidinic site) lyase /endonuclease III [Candidatus Kentron sp. UNK]